ncbi:MAG: hypothetical protein CENE_02626 [Candidatus Celerinatantimonas neptuna]|nr:MAG: hypothetical protein CENE_02626 [Candidatus Celerinatantimonas neptuna]
MLGCVPLSQYCHISGESEAAVKKRIERGIWQIGVQVRKVNGVKERWIDLEAVTEWARNGRI